MNRIVLIGNGFDLAHNLPTRYEDFINWYWDKRVKKLRTLNTKVSEDILCKISISGSGTWFSYMFHLPQGIKQVSGKEVINYIIENNENLVIKYSSFFKNILSSIDTKGWVDIENEYYKLLTHVAFIESSAKYTKDLNGQLQYVEDLLVEYLGTLDSSFFSASYSITKKMYEPINPKDISVAFTTSFKDYLEDCRSKSDIEWNTKCVQYGINNGLILKVKEFYKHGKLDNEEYPMLLMIPDNILFLNFNYTNTLDKYVKDGISSQVHIHGDLSKPEGIIFGYGDEMDSKYTELQKLNENECLRKIKSIKYLESDNYRKVLSFIDSAPYQIYIMGHSCGNSDRTLLNTLFEHKNCFSIKPYFYKKADGTDNYLDLVQNISRNFTDMKLMRDRVVNKTYCETIM